MIVNTGDWVRSYSSGVWQVVHQVPDHFAPRYSLKDPKTLFEGPLLILKRVVSNTWKPSFDVEAANRAVVKPLTKADHVKLQRYLSSHEDVLRDFEAFDKPVHYVSNVGFSLPRRADFAKFKRHFELTLAAPRQQGMTNDAILKCIADSPFAACCNQIPRAATLQFVCENHEVKRRELIYRKLNVHNF